MTLERGVFMEGLLIIFVSIFIIGFILQFLLFQTRNSRKNHHIIMTVSLIFVLIVSYIAFTSQPENYTTKRMIATLWPALAIIAVFLDFRKENNRLPDTVMTLSMLGAIAQMIIL